MSASQSNLSSTGFDYVVAVTQDSVNTALMEYLYGGLPTVVLCYAYDSNNIPQPVDYATFVAGAGNTDPFAVPDGTASSDPRIQALNTAGFAFAVKAALGLPPGVAPADLPPIVALKPGQSNVTYTLMFSEFIATELVFGPRGSVTWVNQSQPSGTVWSFSGAVDLDFQDVAFASLPAAAQARLQDLGDPNMFGVQQLEYDLNSSDLEQGFQFVGVPGNSALNTFMTADFINVYWKALGGAEVLGYAAKQLSATPPSSLAVTDLNFFTPDALGGAPLTLNYLCSTNNDALPDTTHAGFGWNWIDANGGGPQPDGVAALNRNTFARYLANASSGGESLSQYVASNCYLPSVNVKYIGGIELEVKYTYGAASGQTPTVSYPATGPIILSYSYDSGMVEDQAGDGGAWGRMKLHATYDLTVSVSGSQFVLVQHLTIYAYVKYLATSASGNVVDKQITDTYSIGVDGQGELVVALQSSVPVDNSKDPKANGFLNFWADADTLEGDVKAWAASCVATSFTDIPISFADNFVFPGGATFLFADAAFSANQDLVSHINYVQPLVMQITFDSELMENQKHADVMAPDVAFEVLQSQDGDSLFFSIGTDHALYVTRELTATPTGWDKIDLSSALASQHGGAAVAAKAFRVAQNPQTLSIDLALVLTVAGQDFLYLSLGNANTDAAWANGVPWTAVPFDAGTAPNPLTIADVLVMDLAGPTEVIFVDVIRTPGDPLMLLDRYSITPATAPHWNSLDLPIDLASGSIASCLGKRTGDPVPGIYTFGAISGKQELHLHPAVELLLAEVAAGLGVAEPARRGERHRLLPGRGRRDEPVRRRHRGAVRVHGGQPARLRGRGGGGV